jgi:hypothetical protein
MPDPSDRYPGTCETSFPLTGHPLICREPVHRFSITHYEETRKAAVSHSW